MLFAFDWFHDENGKPNKDNSTFFISNQYAAKVAITHSQYFEWVASIHPYRADAIDALQAAHAQGARAIKWLPSGMGIDPMSAKCDAFYKSTHDLNMPIISHTGREKAVLGGNQDDSNPLRMRRALDAGVRVVLAHCASDGDDVDLDNTKVGQARQKDRVLSTDLFARLMDTPKYNHLLVGEISGLTLFNHAKALKPILQRTDWHHRLLSGSDYPLPGIMPFISLAQLVNAGLLQESSVSFLNDLRIYNPLLFDFALKRLISFNGNSFPASVFETRRFFDATPV